jgi:LysM repeat protein
MKNLNDYIKLVEDAKSDWLTPITGLPPKPANITWDEYFGAYLHNVGASLYNKVGNFASNVAGAKPGEDVPMILPQNSASNSAATTPSTTPSAGGSGQPATTGTPKANPSGFGPHGYSVHGNNTKALQFYLNSRLKQLGITGQDIATDGKFGPKTLDALNLVRSKDTDPTSKAQLEKLGANIKNDTPASAGSARRTHSATQSGQPQPQISATGEPYINAQGQEVPSNFNPDGTLKTGAPPPANQRYYSDAQGNLVPSNFDASGHVLPGAPGSATAPAARPARPSQSPANINLHKQMANLGTVRENSELYRILKLADINEAYNDMPPASATPARPQDPPLNYANTTGMTTVTGGNPAAQQQAPVQASTPTPANSNQYPPGYTQQTTQQSAQPAAGQSLWQQIYNLNKDTIGNNPNNIKVGQKLKMPDGQTYTVKQGDALSKIASAGHRPATARPSPTAPAQSAQPAKANPWAGAVNTAGQQASTAGHFNAATQDLNTAASGMSAASKKLDMLNALGQQPAMYESDELYRLVTLADINQK